MPKRRPTAEDAEILLQLWRLFPREAYRWFQGNFSAKTLEEHDKKYPPGSLERDYITQLREFYETVGVLVSQGVLSEDLFFDIAFHISGVWEKLGPVIKDWQRTQNNPAIEENMEWLATRYESWLKTVWKPGLRWKIRKGAIVLQPTPPLEGGKVAGEAKHKELIDELDQMRRRWR